MAKRKKILCTGSGGFILGNFIRQVFYSKLPYNISSIDRVRDSHIIHNIYVNANHAFYIADVRDSHTLHVIFEKERPDVVIHGAAEFNSCMVDTNVVGTNNVIEECVKMGSRMIFISTNRIYGDLKSDSSAPYTESDPMNPNSTFAATKAAGELLVKTAKDLNYNIVRLSDNYGPWQTSCNNIIPHIIDAILNGTDINIYGSGYQTRDWTHVFDTCSALFSVINNEKNKEIYNISSKQEFSNIEVAQIICNTIGKGHDLIKHVEKDFDVRYAMSNDKIKELGWSPQFKLREGIAQTCQWYLSNQYVLKM